MNETPTEDGFSEHRKQPFFRDFESVAKILQPDADPRTMAIVTVAYLENYIVEIIKLRMPGLDHDLHEKLFEHGILSAFVAKLDIAVAMGVLHPDASKQMKLFAKIRNEFAHNFSVTEFDHPDVAKIVDKLIIRIESAEGSSVERVVGSQLGCDRKWHFSMLAMSQIMSLYGILIRRFNESRVDES